MASGPITTVGPIISTAIDLQPKRIVDLGMGTGKYGFLLREQIDWAVDQKTLHLIGVEAFPDHIRQHQRLVYDEIVTADIRDYLTGLNGTRFDLALLCDVIEHFDPQDAIRVCDEALAHADVLLVTTPARFFEQDGADGYQDHRSWWPARKLRELGSRLDAQTDTAQLEHTVFAAFSRTRVPHLVYDPPAKLFARSVRDRLIQRHDHAPTI